MKALHVDAELLQHYDRPGPRYTSYPTAVEFHQGVGAREYGAHLRRLRPDEEISLYIHLPFCERRCTFCGCHVVATRKREVAVRYLEYLQREMDLVVGQLRFRPRLAQFHLGGGTPTYFSPAQLQHLYEMVEERFEIAPGAEMGIEVDPRVSTRLHIDMLAELGFNRLSMGVQDFSAEVQEAIGRRQERQSTCELFHYCRQQGFESINLDLVYGLPRQTRESFARTLVTTLALRPDRVALYSYAHVPWIRGHQKRIEVELLPPRQEKFALFLQAIRSFGAAGYAQIGMDHFALPDDELSRARRRRLLHRNFMGYTVQRSGRLIGLGISAIGEIGGLFAQNHKKLSRYYAALEAGELPVERGFLLSRDDSIRRRVIAELMCNFHLDTGALEREFHIRFPSYFFAELGELDAGPMADGLVEWKESTIEVTPLGRLFVRNVCMVFDPYLRRKKQDRPMFSRTV